MLRPTVFFLLICCVATSHGASVIEAVGGHHTAIRKVVPEGSQVRVQCRIPPNSQLSRMMDLEKPSHIPTVIWLRLDVKDPTNQEIISHGDTLLIDTNPRLRLTFQEETRTSTLIIDKAQVQDGGIFQCQVFIKDEVVTPSSPIEVVIIDPRSRSTSGTPRNAAAVSYSTLFFFFMTLQVISFLYS